MKRYEMLEILNSGFSHSIKDPLWQNIPFTKELKALCIKKDIPYQHDVMGGRTGTNADSINNTGRGVKTALLSVPLRYMHTGCEVVSVSDIENTAKLLAEFLMKKDGECNA